MNFLICEIDLLIFVKFTMTDDTSSGDKGTPKPFVPGGTACHECNYFKNDPAYIKVSSNMRATPLIEYR